MTDARNCAVNATLPPFMVMITELQEICNISCSNNGTMCNNENTVRNCHLVCRSTAIINGQLGPGILEVKVKVK